jgi:hypothetical protein
VRELLFITKDLLASFRKNASFRRCWVDLTSDDNLLGLGTIRINEEQSSDQKPATPAAWKPNGSQSE